MPINQDALRELTNEVCTSMLDLQLVSADSAQFDNDDYYVAVICIYGDKTSGVEVAVPRTLAMHIASVMFAMTDDELADAEIFDAIGEVANIIGGGVKGISSGEAHLSLPCVGRVPQDDGDLRRSSDCVNVHFECEGRHFLVRYIERIGASPQCAP